MENSYVHIGKVLSPQGVRGDIFVYIFSGEAAWEDQWTELLLSPTSEQAPTQKLKIKKKRFHQKQKKTGFVVTLEEVKDRNQAEEISGMQVFVPEDFLVSGEDEEIYLREVLGFKVKDQERGFVGEVIGFFDNGMQDLLVIKNDQSQKFEVPFVEPILTEIRMDDSEILMDIPYGLVPGEEL